MHIYKPEGKVLNFWLSGTDDKQITEMVVKKGYIDPSLKIVKNSLSLLTCGYIYIINVYIIGYIKTKTGFFY